MTEQIPQQHFFLHLFCLFHIIHVYNIYDFNNNYMYIKSSKNKKMIYRYPTLVI